MTIKKILQSNPIINGMIIKYKERERKVSYGNENPDKTFFVIRRHAPEAGLFSFVVTNLGWMKYALDKGYIPVVDMQSFPNTYLLPEQVGKVNAWEYFFEQPCGYSLEDISHSKNVIMSSIGSPLDSPMTGFEEDPERVKSWNIFSRKYLRFSEEVSKRIEEEVKAKMEGEKVLGVLCRGTDYVTLRPSGHPIQPTVSEMIQKVHEKLEEIHGTKVFLASEDVDVCKAFQDEFGELLLMHEQRKYRVKEGENINDVSNEYDMNSEDPAKERRMKGVHYAVTIGLLARCQALVAGKVSGTTGAMLLTEGYEALYLFDLGLYP